MRLEAWDKLPIYMQNKEVKKYYDILAKKKYSLLLKRIFDVITATVLLMFLSPLFFVIAILIRLDSSGDIFYRQIRVTTYGRKFKIHKFRTMVMNADQKGSLVTVNNDSRITRVGQYLRKYRLDELPQLIDIIAGDMSFVGTRPEVPRYVKCYSKEMMATLLLPAGVTSKASILYKDESKILDAATDTDYVYVHKVLPEKMRYNLDSIRKFNIINEIKILFDTVMAVAHNK